MAAQTPVIEATDLTVGYKGVPVVRNVSLSVGLGEIVALVGLNGAGKTTVMKSLAGELKPLRGDIRWHSRLIAGPTFRRVRAGMAYVAEARSIFMNLTVAQNLRLGQGNQANAFTIFPELEPLLPRRAGSLSGGEQQMLTVGRALSAHPELLLIDELSLGLAPMVMQRLLAAVVAAARRGVAVLLVEQQVRSALAIADRGYVMHRGEIIAEGSSSYLYERFERVGLTAIDRRDGS